MRMIKIQNTDDIKCWQGCGATETLSSLPVGIQKSTATLENSSVIPYKAELILKPTMQQLHLLVLSQQAENISTQNPAHNYITLIEDINNKEAVLEGLH